MFASHKKFTTLNGGIALNSHRLFSAVQLSERTNYGWILAPQEKKFTIIFEWQEYIEYIDVFMQFISLWNNRIWVKFCTPKRRSSPSSLTDRNTLEHINVFSAVHLILKQQITGEFLHHKRRNSPSSSDTEETHWIYIDISQQFSSLWNNRLQVNSCNIQKMKFTVIFEWQEYISVNLRTITMTNK